ncbi:MAG: hypothetical protein PHD61_11070 [Bacteroidales bacterium]|nr:hypothetical protein [Lentimicrobiaceae bacterium]MDD5695828.1 hypothetical protein [Bacteroidales bacterium]
MEHSISNSKEGSYKPYVFLYVTFTDRHRDYGRFDFVVDLDFLKQTLEEYIEHSNEWETMGEILYNEVMHDRFSPKIKLGKFGHSVVQYLCSMMEFQRGFDQMMDKGNVYVLNIDVDDHTQSKFYHNEPERFPRYHEIQDRSQYVGNSEILMSFKSKYDLLDKDERQVCTRFVGMAYNLEKHSFLMTDDDLYEWFLGGEYENKRYKNSPEQYFNSILDKLFVYEFIKIEHSQDEDGVISIFEIKICYPEVVYDIIRVNSEKVIDPLK